MTWWGGGLTLAFLSLLQDTFFADSSDEGPKNFGNLWRFGFKFGCILRYAIVN